MVESKPARILYVGDDKRSAQGFKKGLEKSGYDIDIAGSGDRAVDLLMRYSYDLLAIDHSTRGMNGLSILRMLRDLAQLPTTIVIAGPGDEYVTVQAIELGAQNCVIKDGENRYLELLQPIIEESLNKRGQREADEDALPKEQASTDSPAQIGEIGREDGPSLMRFEDTQTIDLRGLLTRNLSATGSFNLSDAIWDTSFGQLIQCLPIPAVIVDESLNIKAANESCVRLGDGYLAALGKSFSAWFPDAASAQKLKAALRRVFETRVPAVLEAALKIDDSLIWGRITLRSVRMNMERFILALVEDFTAEKNQLLQVRKHQSELRRVNKDLSKEVLARKRYEIQIEQARNSLAAQVEKRSAQLTAANRSLLNEIEMRKETETRLAARVVELTAINNISNLLNSSLSIDQALERARAEIHEILKPDMVMVYLLDGCKLASRDIVLAHEAVAVEERRVGEVGECIRCLATENRTPVYSLDLSSDKRHDLDPCRDAGFVSVAVLPLSVGAELSGALALGSKTERDFSEKRDFLETLAANLAVALHNARLHEELRRNNEELEQRVTDRTSQLVGSNERLEREIREKQIVQEALRISEKRYRAIFNNAAVGIIVSGPDGRLTQVNEALEEMLGYTREELVHMTLTDVIRPGESSARDEEDRPIEQWAEERRTRHARCVRKDGSVVFVEITSSAIPGKGEIADAFISVVDDVTERRRYEEQQERLMEELKSFSYVVSHDLKAPLLNIKGFTKELRLAISSIQPDIINAIQNIQLPEADRIRRTFEEDIQESLEFIDASASKMRDLIEAILAISRSGRRELDMEPLDMDRLVKETVATLAYQLNEAGAKVVWSDLPAVLADRVSMEMILGNLIDNAVNYRDPSRPCEIRISGEPLHGETLFRVSDNSLGIRKESLAKIFDLFYRCDGAGSPGEGIGLTTARTLVRRHHGRMWCESEQGVGSTFYFTISHGFGERRDLN